VIAVVGLALAHTAWAQQPERAAAPPPSVASPESVWTPASEAPAALLTRLEGERHDTFIARARAGDIDVVFFGTTSTEMWSWRDRGRSVWDRAFGALKAASFGSQGTRFESLLWRMQHGELDGYQAKLVVLQGFPPGDVAIPRDGVAQFVAGYAAIVAAIRARQSRAKILLFAPFPRGELRRDPWREVATSNAAAYAELVDDETVFYVDIGERFFRADGSHNGAMWGSGVAGVGMQTPAFEVWAQALQPWVDRFVR
jgi:beta-glucosidase